MLKKKIIRIIAAAFIFGVFLTTCDMPMGLGDPVDTVPPTIYIDSPEDNTKMKAITQGNPILMEGIWMDDFGVNRLRFEIIDRWHNNDPVTPVSVKYDIKKTSLYDGMVSGTWTAEIVIDASVLTEYRIRVYALDAFGNEGMAEVNVRIDIIPPWIDSIRLRKHPNVTTLGADSVFTQDSQDYVPDQTDSISGKKDSLPNRQYYVDKGFGVNDPELWREIKWDDIKEFQNESFRISTSIDSIFSNVGAVRLNIYDENGRLLTENSLAPTGFNSSSSDFYEKNRQPYWDITHQMLVGLNPAYSSGLNYISFEIRAWSDTDWDIPNNKPKDDAYGQPEPGRSQRAGGTMWFPESDNPHVYLDRSLILGTTNSITLTSSNVAALRLDFYDDDKLLEIYYGLLPKSDLDDLMKAANIESEDVFFNGMATDATRRSNVLAKCISANPSTNRFTPASGTLDANRTFNLATGAVGEYRFIGLVRECAKTEPNYTFMTGATQKWSVYPRLRIQVQDGEAPLIIVENPLKENAFPNLNSDGQTFKLSGYALAPTKTDRVLIAWTPPGKTAANATDALTAAEAALLTPALWTNGYYTHNSTGVLVWNVTDSLVDQGSDIFGGKTYYRVGFAKTFDLLANYFVISGVNQFKGAANVNSFVIKAFSTSANSNTSKTFRMYGSSSTPLIDVTSHTALQSYQDIEKDLVLIMRVTKGDDIALKNDKINISDANKGSNSATATPPYGVEGFSFNAQTGIAQARVTTTYIKGNFVEGSQRVYSFTAENILGNTATTERTIIMSNNPLIESILCSNGNGKYKEGDVLTFDVTYSMPVMVTGSPRLKLHFGDVTGVTAATVPNAYATYVPSNSTTASNTLQFTYTVRLNDETNLLKNSLYPIDTSLPGTTLKSYMGSDAVTSITSLTGKISMQENQTVQLDGVHPKVLRASFKQDGNNTRYFNNGKTITLELLCSEVVMVSGSPKATIATMTGTVVTFSDLVYSSKSTDGKTISFTYTINNSSINQERQLTWASPWITFPTASDAITDEVGNSIDISTASLPSEENRRGEVTTGNTDNKTAFIKTNTPATPTLTLHSTTAGAAANNTTTAVITGNMISVAKTTDGYLYLRMAGMETTGTTNTAYYSLTGGSNQKSDLAGASTLAYRYSNGTTNGVFDKDWAKRFTTDYTPTSYQIVTWQSDRAGNESAKSVSRDITINSRPAELNGIDIPLNDGAYAEGTAVPFKFSFSQKITANANASVTIEIKGIDSLMNGTAEILNINVPQTNAQNPASSMITVNWSIPSTAPAMKNIKVTNVQFNNMVDEYGNELTRYYGAANDNGITRPIGDSTATYAFQLDRPNLIILSSRPRLVTNDGTNTTTPVIPNGTGNQQNGGLITANTNGVLKLVFVEGNGKAVPLTAVAGKYITIRPYGTWAIPPELSLEDFNYVYDFDYGTNNTAYRRRLSDVDNNGLPKSGSGRGSGYNLYVKNTQGVIAGSQGKVRPNTATKMILDFSTGLYNETNANYLRPIFEAAGWKQQKILATSGNVVINNNIISVTIPNKLDDGRIWEVLIDNGAFQDAARHESQAVTAGTYRFWSTGTATPYIRADKVSYDARDIYDNAHADLAFVSGTTVYRPPIDTRVRIDCETPGATIRYDVIRTSYTLNPGGAQYTSDAFSVTDAGPQRTNNYFFKHPYFTGTDDTANANNGYQNNTIGNAEISGNKDGEGFYNKALVPIDVDTKPSSVTVTLDNGTFPKSALDTAGTNITLSGTVTGNVYQTLNATTGAITLSGVNNTNIPYIYIGELYPGSKTVGGQNNVAPTNANVDGRRAKTDNDIRLFSGRRDYIVARAQKFSVSGTGANLGNSGPDLSASAPGMEGVYKTVLIYRTPQTRNRRILVQGFDNPVMSVVAGFPLRDADSTNTDGNAYNNIFSKNAWRYGLTNAADFNNDPGDNNRHIWVTWEIVTDWYQKGKGFSSATSGNYLDNSGPGSPNSNSVGATYGGVIYRYNQAFYN